MTILELMERANVRDTNLATAFIKDAITQIQSTTDISTKTEKQSLIKGVNEYSVPSDMISLISISILDTTDDSKYKKIRRMTSKPNVVEDTSP
mgnify:FL=1|tara:strand:- start:1014 stop:1292 length:279 start_codon:yes stop_codon:yes gene_type:complete